MSFSYNMCTLYRLYGMQGQEHVMVMVMSCHVCMSCNVPLLICYSAFLAVGLLAKPISSVVLLETGMSIEVRRWSFFWPPPLGWGA